MNQVNQKQALASLKKVSLTQEEKKSMQNRILAYVDHSHAHSNLAPESPYWHVWVWNYSMTRRLVMYFTIALMVFATSSGGLASAADEALPGDLLYDLKVSVFEPAGVVLAIGSEAKASLVAKFAERRLAEAETLMSQGRLDAVKAEEIKVRFVRHAEAFTALEKKVELDGRPEAAKAAQDEFAESIFERYLNLIKIPVFGGQ